MSNDTAKELVKRSDKLFALQSPWLNFWQELALNFYPQRADFNGEIPWGAEYSSHLFDDAPVVQRRDLANSVAAMLRPRGQTWFKPVDTDDDMMDAKGVSDWYEQAGIIQSKWMYKSRSKFVRSCKEADHDFVTFGNAVLSVEVNRTNSGLVFNSHHLRDCAWAEDADGEIDKLNRKMKMTARQIKQRWPKAKLHRDITEACEKEPEKEFLILHLMIPNADYEYVDAKKAKQFKKLPFVSIYLDSQHNEILSEVGSFEFRYVVPRWQPITGSPYAISPATADTLSSARQLQVMARTGNEALEKSVDPPVKAAEDAIRGDINLFAGGITWYDKSYNEETGPALELFDVGKNALLALQAIDAARMRLAAGTYVSKLNLPEQHKEMTAFEVQKRIEEYIREAMPVIEPWESNYSAPMLDATFAILLRVGAFGPVEEIPDALSGRDFEWSFVNPLQETKEKVKVNTFGSVVAMAKSAEFDPSLVNEIDMHKAFRDAARGAGAPEDWMRDEKQADAITQMQGQMAGLQKTIDTLTAAGTAAGTVADGAARMGAAVNGAANAIPA